MNLWRHIEEHITRASGSVFQLNTPVARLGGSNNASRQISDGHRDYFLKTNHAKFTGMFAAEAEALEVLARSNTVRVPAPLCHGAYDNSCYIVLEYLPLRSRGDMALLGRQLAAMHAVTSDTFGWHINNTIGLTAQINTPSNHWVDFWRHHRLGFQLNLAADNGYNGDLQNIGERLLSDCHRLFEHYAPKASLLHGDLWSGNHGALAHGVPVIFDPALYYGDRETDMAMTTLFGGYDNAFYCAYNEIWPLDEGYAVRKTFYNIYHILNHLNLFGGAYQRQAIDMIRRVLCEL